MQEIKPNNEAQENDFVINKASKLYDKFLNKYKNQQNKLSEDQKNDNCSK